MTLKFNREFSVQHGVVEQLSPGIRRVVAANTGPYTFHGTGTYIVGRGEVAIIDPGPEIAEHVDAILAAIPGERISHLVVTHTHNDHSPACRPLQQVCDAQTYGYGPHGSGKFEQGIQVEEGGDMAFVPDVVVRDGDIITGDGWSFECVYTPGHTSNHMCYQLREEKTLFSGDHVMAWNTTIVSPPDGDMADYMRSLELLLERDDACYWPTHGPCIGDPKPYVRAYKAHREQREAQVLGCVADGISRIDDMVRQIYQHLPPSMFPAAACSVFATCILLVERAQLCCDGELTVDARYYLANS